jgi:CDP-diacylglycerol--glycerol-3-phosphate 3-phosphatidyltransferase
MSATETLTPLKATVAVPSHVPTRLKGTLWQSSWLAKTYYESVLALASVVAKAQIAPDWLTAASLFLSLSAGGAAATGHFGFAAFLLVASGSLDLLDGAVARLTNQTSRWGALLDSTVDRFSDALPLGGLLLFYAPHRLAMCGLILNIVFSFTISYVRARAEALGEKLPETFMRRAERVLLLLTSLLLGTLHLPSFDTILGLPNAPMLLSILISTVLNGVGCCLILSAAYRALKSTPVNTMAAHRYNEGTP